MIRRSFLSSIGAVALIPFVAVAERPEVNEACVTCGNRAGYKLVWGGDNTNQLRSCEARPVFTDETDSMAKWVNDTRATNNNVFGAWSKYQRALNTRTCDECGAVLEPFKKIVAVLPQQAGKTESQLEMLFL